MKSRNTKPTITVDEMNWSHLYDFLPLYYSDYRHSQRLGQAFINTVLIGSTVWPELFYEEDSKTALNIIKTVLLEVEANGL